MALSRGRPLAPIGMRVPRPKWDDQRPEVYFYGAECRTCFTTSAVTENANDTFEWMHAHWVQSNGHSRFFKFEVKRERSEVITSFVKGTLGRSLQLELVCSIPVTCRMTIEVW